MKQDRVCYELSPSQDVVYLQCKYTLFKRVINILTSVSVPEKIDVDMMTRAFNLLVERNDCLRIRFFKKGGKLMQYFGDAQPIKKIPVLKFNTQKEQNDFILKIRKRPIAYLRGKVIQPYFIETYDNKSMVLFKVCHLVLDIYGINVIFKDLFAVYNALKKGEALPDAPGSFEEVIAKDIERSHDEALLKRNLDYFTGMMDDCPEPYYAGLHGPDNKIWQKKLASNHRGMKMFFIHNDTEAYRHVIDSSTVSKLIAYCTENRYSPANLLFYACSLTAAKLNNNTRNMLPLALYNCRISAADKNCAGTKVRSIACYTRCNYKGTFAENFDLFSSQQNMRYKHVGFSDRAFESLLHNTYRSSMLETYYFLTYSFIPFDMEEGYEFDLYTNGKGALPAYVIQLFNVKTNEIIMAYDVHTKTTSEEAIKNFHAMYLNVLNQVLDNPQIKLSDIQL